ncbi:redoxin domain-containing protein [Oleiharenicola lentus]|uniref:Redoxin domain-containing protein n=2 Tax=Oleiharenicola lentus TaxID=2508720 RepID=A0A4Q1CAC3_9BACT|nr:redoxin domain-containing protein [Oleiharenicola lentus]
MTWNPAGHSPGRKGANLLTILRLGKWVGGMLPRYSCAAVVMFCLLMVAAGCGKRPDSASGSANTNATPVAPAEIRHPLKGEILQADGERQVLIVTHDEIKGYMPAMTMEFKVTKADVANAKPGQRIRAELVERNGDYFLEKIWPDDTVTVSTLDAAAKALAQDTAIRGKEAYREIGENLPGFTLLDQEGRTVAANRFRGKRVVLNFIFTRCPIATMCPAATLKMAQLQQAAREAGAKDFELVSVSLDPEYDTPGVLRDYAEARGLDLANWSFLTGPDTAVRHLLTQLGVIREFEGATIKHTLATVLIDETGRIIYRADGSSWQIDDFVKRLKRT